MLSGSRMVTGSKWRERRYEVVVEAGGGGSSGKMSAGGAEPSGRATLSTTKGGSTKPLADEVLLSPNKEARMRLLHACGSWEGPVAVKEPGLPTYLRIVADVVEAVRVKEASTRLGKGRLPLCWATM